MPFTMKRKSGFSLVELILSTTVALPLMAGIALAIHTAAQRMDTTRPIVREGVTYHMAPSGIAYRDAIRVHRLISAAFAAGGPSIYVLGGGNANPATGAWGQPIFIPHDEYLEETDFADAMEHARGKFHSWDLWQAGAGTWSGGSTNPEDFVFVVADSNAFRFGGVVRKDVDVVDGRPANFYRVRVIRQSFQPDEYAYWIFADEDPLQGADVPVGARHFWLRNDPQTGRVDPGAILMVFPDPMLYTRNNELARLGADMTRMNPMSRFIYFEEAFR